MNTPFESTRRIEKICDVRKGEPRVGNIKKADCVRN
jgi:hypothetical protein